MSKESSSEELHQLLVVVMDINPHQLLFARQPGSFSKLLNSVMSLLNQHLMLNPTNQVALLAAHATGCSYLYPDPAGGSQLLRQQDGQYEEFYQVETVIRERVGVVMAKDKEGGQASSESLLSGALAMALAYINKQQSGRVTTEKLRPRLLAMSATGDSAAQYMNYMNVFFTAQKLNITLDTCMLLQDSGLLQQGSDITGGLYVKVEQLPGLLQYLTWLFLPGPSLRKMLGAPPPVRVDYRAACFCHRQLVDVGFVCSVCLSIFCRFNPVCTTCHSVFKAPGKPPHKKKKVMSENPSRK